MSQPNFYLCIFFLLLPFETSATPPDVLSSRIVPMCANADEVVLWMQTNYNHGTYYDTESLWLLLFVDLKNNLLNWHELGGMSVNTVNVIDEDELPELKYTKGKSSDLGTILKKWKMSRCEWSESLTQAFMGMSFKYSIEKDGVHIFFNEKHRKLKDVRGFDPRFISVRNLSWYSELNPPMHGLLDAKQLFNHVEGPYQPLVLSEEIFLKTRYMLILRVKSETGDYDLLVSLSGHEVFVAQSQLVDDFGVTLLEDNEFVSAEEAFRIALKLQSYNNSARYNRARALAMLEHTNQSVALLKELPLTTELRKKIEKDKYFDKIRAKHEFSKFLESFPGN